MSGAGAPFGLRRPGLPEAGLDEPSPAPPFPLDRLRQAADGQSVAHWLRRVIFVATLLVTWISFKPFADLARPEAGEIVTGTETLTYLTFGGLACIALALAVGEHGRALRTLVSPWTVALAAWLCLGVLFSRDPGTSVKRLGLTAAVLVLMACLPLLPRSRAEFAGLLAASALGLIGACYLGMLLVPQLSIHQASDVLEPQLAGNWRGVFGHKNAAAAVMAMMLFVGVGVFRAGLRWSGAAVVGFAGLFLVGAEGKSALAMTLAVFALTGLLGLATSTAARAMIAFGPLLLFNLFTVGTVMSAPLAALVAQMPVDPTFTGRTEIWRFALEAIAARPITGYGFFAFWNSQSIRDTTEDGDTWAGLAAHAHNGFIDTALMLGIVGLSLLLVVFVIGPFRDALRLYRAGPPDPLATMLVQIWLFGLLLATMESFFFNRADPVWVTFLLAVFGLRYLSRFASR